MAAREFLVIADVARIWSEEAGRPIKETTVWSYLEKSKPVKDGKTLPYSNNPVPKPDGRLPRRSKLRPGEDESRGRVPWWAPDREEELRLWWHSRPGPGRPRNDGVAPARYTTLAELARANPRLAEQVRQRLATRTYPHAHPGS